MTQRRDFLRLLAAASAVVAASRAGAAEPDAAGAAAAHDMSAFPASWMGKEQIAMVLYPGFTALDFVGPQYMFAGLMGAKVHLVAQSEAPVMSDTGLAIAPTMTLAQCPKDLDILFLPGGGQGTLDAMRDTALINWLAARAPSTKLLASVCTGSLLLGQAGLLRGKSATSHWVTRSLLSEFGAVPVNRRVVWDGNVVTAAGVSAGLDLGLTVVARLRDELYAQSLQLLAEYAPEPPVDAGTPERAGKDVTALVGSMFVSLLEQMRAASRQALGAG